MRYVLLLLFPLLTGCTILGPGEFDFSVDILDIANTPEGMLVTFSVDSDGEDVFEAGVGYGRDSIFNISVNQENARITEEGLFEVLLSGVDDGLVYVQAFAGFDGFYELSDIVAFQVSSAAVTVPCTPPLNALRVLFTQCNEGQAEVRTRSLDRDGYEVRVNCNQGDRSELILTFPRNPTSGTYRIVGSIFGVPPRTQFVTATFQIGSQFTSLETGRDIYVNRTGNRTEITICGVEFPIQGTRREITTRIGFDR
jgi:hypothetical protein